MPHFNESSNKLLQCNQEHDIFFKERKKEKNHDNDKNFRFLYKLIFN
jgi:uncharacterized membrane-anchored protein YhcB (DUF1043 family)